MLPERLQRSERPAESLPEQRREVSGASVYPIASDSVSIRHPIRRMRHVRSMSSAIVSVV